MTEFSNHEFDIPGLGQGDAEDWTVEVYLQGAGFAKFRTFNDFIPSERWEDYSSFARLWSGYETYDLDKAITIYIPFTSIGTTNDIFLIPGDFRKLLPPSSSFLVSGVNPGETELDAYWTVDKTEFNGSHTKVYVTENIISAVDVNIIIPPIFYLNIDSYGWGARLVSVETYPLGPPFYPAGIPPWSTINMSINRQTSVVITFTAGGEVWPSEVVNTLNSEFVSLGIDDEVIAVVENSLPVIKTLRQSTDATLMITGGTVSTLFSDKEEYGFGQFAQLFDGYFEDNMVATSAEVVDVLKTYVQHGYFRMIDSEAADRFFVRSEKTGELATIKAWGHNGEVMSDATWPIPAITPSTNILKLVVDGVDLDVALTTGATTADEILDDIQNAIDISGTDTIVDIVGDGQIVIGSKISIKVDSAGTTNSDLGFIEDVIFYGNNNIHTELGFYNTEAVGKYDVGFYEDFDETDSFTILFASGTSLESQYEQFEWAPVADELLNANSARMKSWAEWIGSGDIILINLPGEFQISGNKTDYYYAGASAMVQGSTLNDGIYTVTGSTYFGGVTKVNVSQTIPSSTADGRIYSMFFNLEDEDFEQSWENTFLTNSDAPPMNAVEGVLIGNEITFPLEIPSNRNELLIYIDTDQNLILLRVDDDVYDTAGDLVANLNTKLSLKTSTDLEFSIHEESEDQTIARIGFGWDATGSVTQEFFFINQHGRHEGLDIRPLIGMTHFIDGQMSAVKVPSAWFSKIDGTSSIKEPKHWESSSDFYDVDPDSRISYSIQTTAAGDIVVVYEGHDFALFNSLSSPDNSSVESYIPEGWGGSILDLSTWEATLDTSIFNTGSTKPDVGYEDFESPWED